MTLRQSFFFFLNLYHSSSGREQNKIKQEEVEEEEEEKEEEKLGTTDWRLFHGETKEKRINKRAHKLLLLLLRVDTHLYTPFVCAPFCRRSRRREKANGEETKWRQETRAKRGREGKEAHGQRCSD